MLLVEIAEEAVRVNVNGTYPPPPSLTSVIPLTFYLAYTGTPPVHLHTSLYMPNAPTTGETWPSVSYTSFISAEYFAIFLPGFGYMEYMSMLVSCRIYPEPVLSWIAHVAGYLPGLFIAVSGSIRTGYRSLRNLTMLT